MAASAQAEAERIKAKLPLPPAASEGKFEVRFVQALVEIMTGRATVAKPDMVKMPETAYEQIVLVLSSTGQFYYRVTPQGCTCKGYIFRGKSALRTFPELVANEKMGIAQKAARRARQNEGPFAKVQSRPEEYGIYPGPGQLQEGPRIRRIPAERSRRPPGPRIPAPWTTKIFAERPAGWKRYRPG